MDKIYIPHQLKALLPSDMYKVLDTLFAFQKEGTITYSKRNSEFLHIDQSICDQCIQTAIDKKIIKPVEMAGGIYRFQINEPIIEAAKLLPLTEIPNRPLIKLSEEITFKQTMGKKELTNQEIMEQIRVLQAQLMKQTKEDNKLDDLPF